MIASIYDDDTLVGELTRKAFQQVNSRLLQIHRLHSTDDLHAAALLEIFNPIKHAIIVDVGCGVGSLAAIMNKQRPDVVFILVNKSKSQLAMCPPRFTAIRGTAEKLPIPEGMVDAVMMTYVLGHVNLPKFVKECSRVNADRVYLYDLFVDDPHFGSRLGVDLQYQELTMKNVILAFEVEGFHLLKSETTRYVPEKIAALMPRTDTLNNTLSAAMVFGK